jgi:AraC-like DNA-binding protein
MALAFGQSVRTQREWSRYRIVTSGIELLEAAFVKHVYERHFHDTYAVGVTLRGVQRFRCGGRRYDSMPSDVIVIAPGDSHDGESGTADGYAYRMFYLAEPLFREVMCDATDRQTAAPRGGVLLHDEALADALSSAWTVMSEHPFSLVAEERLLRALCRLVANAPLSDTTTDTRPSPVLARVRDYIHEHVREHVSLAELAGIAGMSRFQLTRRFQGAYGLPLHAYHLQARLHEVKRRLTSGESISSVALDLGFSDQSHMHRRFKAAFGVTPGQWRSATARGNARARYAG